MQLKKSEGNPRERVKRRVIRLEHLLTTVILREQKKGLIRNLPVKEIDALLFSLIESALFKISVYGEQSLEDSRLLIEFTIDSLKTSQE